MITKPLSALRLGNKIPLPGTKLFAGMCSEEMSLILVEKHQEEYIFDVVYHGVIVAQVATKEFAKEWDVWV